MYVQLIIYKCLIKNLLFHNSLKNNFISKSHWVCYFNKYNITNDIFHVREKGRKRKCWIDNALLYVK